MFAIGLGLVCGLYVLAHGRANPDFVSDFDQVWAGARALLEGKDPYQVVGPRGAFVWKWPLYYPLPALMVVSPLGLLPVLAARVIFAGVSASLLAWGATRDGWQRLPIFISVSFMVCVELVQWSSLYTATFFLPALALVGVAKPNFGVAIATSARSNRTLGFLVIGSLALIALSEIIRRHDLAPSRLIDLIDAREDALEAPLDAARVGGGLAELQLDALGVRDPVPLDAQAAE